MDTLLLNKDASPISILPLSAVGWQEAIKYIWLDRVHVLEWYDDWVVRSPSWETRVPAVMMVKDYVKAKKYPRFSKYNVTLRDHFECQYCGVSVTNNVPAFLLPNIAVYPNVVLYVGLVLGETLSVVPPVF